MKQQFVSVVEQSTEYLCIGCPHISVYVPRIYYCINQVAYYARYHDIPIKRHFFASCYC